MGIFLKDINLKGKTALITGATKGLGRGAAIAIAEAGGNIIAVGRNQIELNTLKKEIKKFKNKVMKNIPLGRVAKESDVATAVAFLAADSSEMITGTSLLVDGGWTAQ